MTCINEPENNSWQMTHVKIRYYEDLIVLRENTPKIKWFHKESEDEILIWN